MPVAVLYRWKLKPGREQEFSDAWEEGTRQIHLACKSYGAALHEGETGLFWSYAMWPDEETRKSCFADNDWFSLDCFQTMQDCVVERFEEIPLHVRKDELQPREPRLDVPRLSSARLDLRPLRLSDASSLLPALQNEETMRFWSRGPLKDLAEAEHYLAWNIGTKGVQTWAITRSEDSDLALGWVALIDEKPGAAELGYILCPSARGKGHAREAVNEVLDYAFGPRGLRRVFADSDPENLASIRLLEAVGFQLEGRLRAAWHTHIGVRDSLIYGQIASDRGQAKPAEP
ncbi:GNAT family N-acetyltransferase [Maricaulis sp. CAU 1757]